MFYVFAFLLFFNASAVDDLAIENPRLDRVLDNKSSRDKSNVIKPILEIALKEPIRYINFWAKTNKLKKEGKVISCPFKLLTTLRFFGSTITDACTISLIVNQFLDNDNRFLDIPKFYYLIAAFSVGETFNVLSRSIVRENYKEESSHFL